MSYLKRHEFMVKRRKKLREAQIKAVNDRKDDFKKLAKGAKSLGSALLDYGTQLLSRRSSTADKRVKKKRAKKRKK